MDKMPKGKATNLLSGRIQYILHTDQVHLAPVWARYETQDPRIPTRGECQHEKETKGKIKRAMK
jgi:hypothetical protein